VYNVCFVMWAPQKGILAAVPLAGRKTEIRRHTRNDKLGFEPRFDSLAGETFPRAANPMLHNDFCQEADG
jgi:hypothetical protein